jgi:hypothetical protein
MDPKLVIIVVASNFLYVRFAWRIHNSFLNFAKVVCFSLMSVWDHLCCYIGVRYLVGNFNFNFNFKTSVK